MHSVFDDQTNVAINSRTVVRGTGFDRIERVDESFANAGNTGEDVYLVDVVSTEQVNGVFADVIDLDHVLLPDLSLEASHPLVNLRRSQTWINCADRTGTKDRRRSQSNRR